MSWAHDDLLREMRQGYDQLTPQEKMARCKEKRREQLERWLVYDQSLADNSRIHFQYHKPRRKRYRNHRGDLVEQLAHSKNGVAFEPNIALLDAVNRADINAVKFMIKCGADPNSADEDGLTALHQACIDNCEEIVKLLLHYGSDVDCRDSEDWTPLHACTTCGHINIARILLDNGADLLALNADLSMPYDICEDDSPMLEFIENAMETRKISQDQINDIRAHPENIILQDVTEIWNNSRRNPHATHQISGQRNQQRHQQKLASNNFTSPASPAQNKRATSNAATTTTSQAVRKSIRNNDFHIDDQLISNPDKCTLLHIAAANGYVNLCRKLLKWSASPDVKDADGWTPSHASCCWSQRDVLQQLIEGGADVNIRNRMGEKASEVTDDQEIIGFMNHLVREQRQRRRQRELQDAQAQREARGAKEGTGQGSHSFNRSQGSRRSARSQSFRRRSIRKGNKDNVVGSNSATSFQNDDEPTPTTPHTAEAKLEAAFWRGEVTSPTHQTGESSSSADTPKEPKQTAASRLGSSSNQRSQVVSPTGSMRHAGDRSSQKRRSGGSGSGPVSPSHVQGQMRVQSPILSGSTAQQPQGPSSHQNANPPQHAPRGKNSGCCSIL